MDRSTRNKLRKLRNILSDGPDAPGLKSNAEKETAEEMRNDADWLYEAGVQGIGTGYKVTDDQISEKPSLRVYVEKKQPASALERPAPASLIDKNADEEIAIDVVEVGKITPHAFTNFRRPLHPGLSVSNITRDAGTLGAVVRSRSRPEEVFILSSYHILAPSPGNQGHVVTQPSLMDSDTRHEIANHVTWHPLHFSAMGYPNTADAAISRLNRGISYRSRLPVIGHLKGVTGLIQEGDIVKKVGRTTGYDIGEILDMDAMISLDYPGGRAGFRNQVLCTRYGEPGDSGSLVVTRSGKAVGLHVGGSNTTSMFSRIVPILREMDVELIVDAEEQVTPESASVSYLHQLIEPHRFSDSVRWKLTDTGVEVAGSVEVSQGPLVTIPRIWNQYNGQIINAANRFEVPVELITACIATESGGNPEAVREEPGYVSDSATPNKISAGLMQTLISTASAALNRPTSRDWLIIPANSIDAGTAYIQNQYQKTRFDPPKVAAAYNAGGVYENNNRNNRWKMKQYPIGTGKHCDRFVMWFNDCFRLFQDMNTNDVPDMSFFKQLRSV